MFDNKRKIADLQWDASIKDTEFNLLKSELGLAEKKNKELREQVCKLEHDLATMEAVSSEDVNKIVDLEAEIKKMGEERDFYKDLAYKRKLLFDELQAAIMKLDGLHQPDFHVPCEQAPKDDPVDHPGHYTHGDVECIDAIKAACAGIVGFEGYCTGNAIKYLWRWSDKGGVQDLEKAEWYIKRLVDTLSTPVV